MAKTAVSILREELAKLEAQAGKLRAALTVLGVKAMSAVHQATAPRPTSRKRRKMSPAAKRKMSRMAKARWAARKRAGHKSL